MAFEDQLEHENHHFEVKVCSMSTIKALYRANDDAMVKHYRRLRRSARPRWCSF